MAQEVDAEVFCGGCQQVPGQGVEVVKEHTDEGAAEDERADNWASKWQFS